MDYQTKVYIRRIEIKNFRSIKSLIVHDMDLYNIFVGSNDAGKSNILRALNLFLMVKLTWIQS